MASIFEIKELMRAAESRKLLSRVYCKAEENVQPEIQRIEKLMEGFRSVFQCGEDRQVFVCTAAGRTEVGGNHTDHQRGKVLAASVDLDAIACVAQNDLGVARLYSEGYGMVEVKVSELEKVMSEENTTVSLVRGILARTVQLGFAVGGFDAYIRSDVPGGSGLSSSACYEVLIGVMVNHLFCEDQFSMAEIAMMGQYAENVYFGKPSGLMDQMACALGGIVSIDFADAQNPVYTQVDCDFMEAGHALCIVDTGADHADLTADYGAIPQEMKAVAQLLGGEVLSEVVPAKLYDSIPMIREKLGDRAVLRAIHYFTDVTRVEQQVAALNDHDFDRFLTLVKESGRSSNMYLQNIATFRNTAEQPVAVALAVAEHLLCGRGAFRVHGGGFAGTIQAFVPVDMLDEFKKGMDAVLGEGSCRVLNIRPVGGAVLLG